MEEILVYKDKVKKFRKKKKSNIVFDVICYVLAAILMFIVIYGLVCKFKGNDVYLFGYRTDIVTSESMSFVNDDIKVQEFLDGHNDRLYKGDLIFSKKVDETTELKLYDVVLFQNFQNNGKITVHRIVNIFERDGKLRYTIRADTANFESDDGAYERKYIVAKLEGRLPGAGYVYSFITSIYGYIMIAGLIIIVFVTDALLSKATYEENHRYIVLLEETQYTKEELIDQGFQIIKVKEEE